MNTHDFAPVAAAIGNWRFAGTGELSWKQFYLKAGAA
jgi:hypothetical protein